MSGLHRNPKFQRDLLLHAIVEHAPCAIVACNARGIVIECNSVGLAMFGYKDEEVLNQPLTMLMPEPHRSAHDGYMKAYMDGGVARVVGRTRMMEGVRHDGSPIMLRLQVARHDGPDGPIFVGVLEDLARIDEARRRLESDSASLDRASRRTAATVLAAMVVHELNQPLAAASARLDAAELRLASEPGGDMANAALGDIRVAAQEIRWAGSVIRRLRRSLGDEPPSRAPTDLNAVVRIAAYMASNETDIDHVALSLDLDDALPPLMTDRIQIQQALMNLIRNAIDAARDGHGAGGVGAVTLSTRREDGHVAVCVADNGPGLDPEMRRTLFTPFLSSKPGGLGLGLAISRTLVEANGGELALGDRAPQGVEAIVRLPVM